MRNIWVRIIHIYAQGKQTLIMFVATSHHKAPLRQIQFIVQAHHPRKLVCVSFKLLDRHAAKPIAPPMKPGKMCHVATPPMTHLITKTSDFFGRPKHGTSGYVSRKNSGKCRAEDRKLWIGVYWCAWFSETPSADQWPHAGPSFHHNLDGIIPLVWLLLPVLVKRDTVTSTLLGTNMPKAALRKWYTSSTQGFDSRWFGNGDEK